MQKANLKQYDKFTTTRPTTYWFDDLGRRFLLPQGTTLKFFFAYKMLDCWLVARSDSTLMFVCQLQESDITRE